MEPDRAPPVRNRRGDETSDTLDGIHSRSGRRFRSPRRRRPKSSGARTAMIRFSKTAAVLVGFTLAAVGMSLWAQQPDESRPSRRVRARPQRATQPAPKAAAEKPARPAYVVEPPDLIIVEVLEALPGRPISGERLVRSDGKISSGLLWRARGRRSDDRRDQGEDRSPSPQVHHRRDSRVGRARAQTGEVIKNDPSSGHRPGLRRRHGLQQRGDLRRGGRASPRDEFRIPAGIPSWI